MLNMKQTDLKLGEGTTAGPMVTFLREDQLRSLKTKRKEMTGTDNMSLVAKQRRAIFQKQEKDEKKKEAHEKKQAMIIGRKTLIIKEVEEEQITETESEDGDEDEKA